MPLHPTRRRARLGRAVGVLIPAALLAGVTAGCTDDEKPPPPPASSLASRATEGWASATAEAGRRFDEFTQGFDVKDDIRVASPTTASDGRTTAELTVRNTTDSTRSFLVEVHFTDPDDRLLDVTFLTVDDVPAGESAQATARSTHDLSGEVRAKVERAVRY
ncbi:hypothetical protein N4P33_25510 [Streptomyces sp. 15-116A]|uniref:hypothetical protein n=1 Tax=Streptomyces sp. 15-116A TaxID=2259035 RepID=UPI0021B199E7|nr:hypothetical protein [Streptomyces sp. 15-116A]MCT7355488.1 hypothetical protein [Streptomyces sp. 15-116A]